MFSEHKREPECGFATALKLVNWFLLSLTVISLGNRQIQDTALFLCLFKHIPEKNEIN